MHLQDFVRRVRDAFDDAFPPLKHGWGCPFHLARCYCGAPSWGQPCPTCGYYPMYGSTGTTAKPNSATREEFVARAQRYGGVAAWYFAAYRSNLAYAKRPDYAAKIEALVAAAKGWADVPDPGQIWDWVCGGAST